jgi:hypothetical protein
MKLHTFIEFACHRPEVKIYRCQIDHIIITTRTYTQDSSEAVRDSTALDSETRNTLSFPHES